MRHQEVGLEFTAETDTPTVAPTTPSTEGRLRNSSKLWTKTKARSHHFAQKIVVAQEFLRLLFPDQPETRLLIEPTEDSYYLLKEKKPDLESVQTPLTPFSYHSLGQIILVSFFIEEIDLQMRDLKINQNEQLIKTQSSLPFSEEDSQFAFNISCAAVHKLPNPQGFYTYNWLEIIQENKFISKMNLTQEEQMYFRQGVNEAIVKIACLPHEVIEYFISILCKHDELLYENAFYYPEDEQNERSAWFIQFFAKRQLFLVKAALYEKSFVEYLEGDASQQVITELFEALDIFIVNGTTRLIPSLNREEVKEALDQRFATLRQQNQNLMLLDELENYRVNDQDLPLGHYLNKKEAFILNAPSHSHIIREELLALKEVLTSPVVTAINEIIKEWKTEKCCCFFTSAQRANRLAKAMIDTPLMARSSVLANTGLPNAVQEALATHKGFARDTIYKDKTGHIIVAMAPEIYKRLVQCFVQEAPQEETTSAKREDARAKRVHFSESISLPSNSM